MQVLYFCVFVHVFWFQSGRWPLTCIGRHCVCAINIVPGWAHHLETINLSQSLDKICMSVISYCCSTFRFWELRHEGKQVRPWRSPASPACRHHPWAGRPSRRWRLRSRWRRWSRLSLQSRWNLFRPKMCTFLRLRWKGGMQMRSGNKTFVKRTPAGTDHLRSDVMRSPNIFSNTSYFLSFCWQTTLPIIKPNPVLKPTSIQGVQGVKDSSGLWTRQHTVRCKALTGGLQCSI